MMSSWFSAWRTPAVRVAFALLALWALELFVVQELSLLPSHSQSVWSPWINRLVRLSLDLTVCGFALAVLPRRALVVLFAFDLFFYLVVLCYRDYYGQSLSVLVIRSQTGEGLSVVDAAVTLLRPWHALLGLTLVAKLYLLFRHVRPTPSAWRPARRVGLALAVLYALGLATLNATLKPMWKIAKWESVGGTGSIYGYLPTWGAELVYIDSAALLARALERARKVNDRLTPLEAPLPIGERLVFLQIESLDLALMDFRIRGQEVIPNLNRLAKKSLYFAVRADKGTGSSDADFTALTGKLPSSHVATYKILDYPYQGSFVERIRAKGYRARALHNVSGEFYNRRHAYGRMGFDELVFKEELMAAGLPAEGWAVHDRELLAYSARTIAAGTGKQFAIVITASTHLPFHSFDPKQAVFFPGSRVPEDNYLDAFHEVDRAIGRFIEALPAGTTVAMYGDHTSKVEQPDVGYRQLTGGGIGCVPFLVHVVGQDLSAQQRTPRAGQTCSYMLQDALRYVQGHVR